ncbi:hypothetical protein CANARDRAFT_5481 [[Candida] arabinofermentans NRRL YB-2248]|uniref:Uncharacterized protein n=1 Tax=[Candida] arabinofermentans NRRL YB-2248 TaxID=983967 RepID=A0A1E4T8V6_9ASCO|nr:hypothetical protein CANARDRAFT_5481 [[Candida] arabinofermentans NRRL YB-2248]
MVDQTSYSNKLDNYKNILNESFENSRNLLDSIIQFKSDSTTADSVNDLSRKSTLDTVPLLLSKNELKVEFNKLDDSLKSKSNFNYQQYNNVNNLSYKSQHLKNIKLINECNALLEKIPELKIGLMIDDEDDDNDSIITNGIAEDPEIKKDNKFLKSLNKDTLEIKKNYHDLNFEPYQVSESQVNEVEQILKKDDVRKFRLSQLNDRLYARERTQLQQLQMKWNSKLQELVKFIKEDTVKLKNDLIETQVQLNKEREIEEDIQLGDEDEEEDDQVSDLDESIHASDDDKDDRMDDEPVLDNDAEHDIDLDEDREHDHEHENENEHEPKDRDQDEETETESNSKDNTTVTSRQSSIQPTPGEALSTVNTPIEEETREDDDMDLEE